MTEQEFQEKVLIKLDKLEDGQILLHTFLLGADGQNGLARKVDDVCKKNDDLNGKFKLLVGILVGSGVLTGGAIGILKIIGA